MEHFFKLKEHGTDVRTEIIAGVTTFMTMAYILAVNPAMLGPDGAGMDSGAVFTATALASAAASFLMAFLANLPFVLSAGMGLNAYFAYTVCGSMGYSWEVALTAVFVEGIIFILLSLTRVREALFNAIPATLKIAVAVGIWPFHYLYRSSERTYCSGFLYTCQSVFLPGLYDSRNLLLRRHYCASGPYRHYYYFRAPHQEGKGEIS